MNSAEIVSELLEGIKAASVWPEARYGPDDIRVSPFAGAVNNLKGGACVCCIHDGAHVTCQLGPRRAGSVRNTMGPFLLTFTA